MPKYKLPKKPGELYIYYKPANGIPLFGKNMRGDIAQKYVFMLLTYMNNFGHLDREDVLAWYHASKNNPDPELIMNFIQNQKGGK